MNIYMKMVFARGFVGLDSDQTAGNKHHKGLLKHSFHFWRGQGLYVTYYALNWTKSYLYKRPH